MDDKTGSFDACAFDEIADEFAARVRRGETPTIDEYVDRHPDHAEPIREFFPMLAQFEDVKAVAAAPPPSIDDTPKTIGDYRIYREIGRGGMGVVYEAEQESLGRRVALKVLPQPLARSASSRERFQREARAAAALHHTNIVPVFEVGSDDGFDYYAMQFIRGHGLDEIIEQLDEMRSKLEGSSQAVADRSASTPKKTAQIARSLETGRFDVSNSDANASSGSATAPPEGSSLRGGESQSSSATGGTKPFFRSVALAGQQVADALAHAHSRGVVHRDIKPSNLLLETTGEVWVTDFGLAKTGDVDLTETGEVVGTLRYLSPERFSGQCDECTDIYALGATLYELLTLQPAFETTDRLQLIEQIRDREPVSPRSINRRIPADLETIVLKAMTKNPRGRYANARAMADDLQRFFDDRPIHARRVSQVERLARWSRRNPGLAASLACVFALLVTVSGVFAVGQRTERAQRVDLESQLYRAEMTMAGRASGSVLGLHEVERLSSRWWPSSERPNRVGWEWYHFDSLSRQHYLDIDLGEMTLGGTLGWGRDAKEFFATDSTGVIRVIDAESGEIRSSFQGPGGRISEISISPDGQRLLIACLDGRVQIRDPVSHQLSTEFNVGNSLFTIHWHPNSETIVVEYFRGLPSKIFDLTPAGAELSWTPEPEVYGAAYSSDGRYMAAIRKSRDCAAIVFDLTTREVVRTCPFPRVDRPGYLEWSPDGSSLAWGSSQGAFVWVDWATTEESVACQPALRNRAPLNPAGFVSWSPDGTRFATGGSDGVVRIWRARDGKELRAFSASRDDVTDVTWSSFGDEVVAITADGRIRGWDVSTVASTHDCRFPGSSRKDSTLTWSQDGTELFQGKYGSLLVDVDTGTLETLPQGVNVWDGRDRFWGFEGGMAKATALCLSSRTTGEVIARQVWKGYALAAARAPDLGVFVWSLKGELWFFDEPLVSEPRRIATGFPDILYAFAASPNARWLITSTYRSLRWYDTRTGKMEREVPRSVAALRIRFSADSRRFVATSGRPELPMFDVETGEHVLDFVGHVIEPLCAAFHPDGTRLASGGADGTVRIWDAETGDLITELEHEAEVHAVEWSSDGVRLATLLKGGVVRVREAPEYRLR